MNTPLLRTGLLASHFKPLHKIISRPFSENFKKMAITDWVDRNDKSGEFKRGPSQWRNSISKEKDAEFPAEKGRYHIFVSLACPWAHRTLITRQLKGLEDYFDFTTVHWEMLEGGWRFVTPEDKDAEGINANPDPLPGHEKYTHLKDIYFAESPDYKGRFTVPTLYDTIQKRIVNNESSEIIRMMNTEFNHLLPEKYAKVDIYPENLRPQIDEHNDWTYNDINNGVYKSGFATTQEAYEKNVKTLFVALDKAEHHLATTKGPFYWGKNLTEADIRLYVTIIRFDSVYVQHFKTNLKDIRSGYPHLHKWMRMLYWNIPAFKDTTDFLHIKNHYTKSHKQINPFSITPLGPEKDILAEDEEVPAVAFALAAKK